MKRERRSLASLVMTTQGFERHECLTSIKACLLDRVFPIGSLPDHPNQQNERADQNEISRSEP